MNDILPISHSEIDGFTIETINARKLYEFLEVQTLFAHWIQRRIEEGRFIEGRDYMVVFAKSGKNYHGGRPRTDYHITLHMAEHLAMMERNEKGYQIRDHYIQKRRYLDRLISGQTGEMIIKSSEYIAFKEQEVELIKIRTKIEPKRKLISREEELEIASLKEQGLGTIAIARRLGRSTSGVEGAYKRHCQRKQGVTQ